MRIPEDSPLFQKWWLERDHDFLEAKILKLEQDTKTRADIVRRRCADLLAIYQGTIGPDDGVHTALLSWWEDSLSYNVTRSCSDTLISHVMNNRVNPMFITDKGSWEDQEKAKGSQRAVEAQFYDWGIYGALGENICSDGIVYGTGSLYAYPDENNGRLLSRRIRPWEIRVSQQEVLDGNIRSLGLCYREDRSLLLAVYGDDKERRDAILSAPESKNVEDEFPEKDSIADSIDVHVWFHLPSGRVDKDDPDSWEPDKAEHDGRWVVAVNGGVLVDTPWVHDYFPVAMFRPKQKRRGFRGLGIPEQLIGVQLEITKMMQRISGIMQLHAIPILAADQRMVNPSRLTTNDWSRILLTKGPPGQALHYVTPQSVPAEYIAQLQRLIEYAYRELGISELSASAQKPKGIEAGVALQLLQDTESIRHTPTFRSWEQFHVDLGKISVDGFRILSERAKREGRNFEVVWSDDHELVRMDWSEIDMAESKYRLKIMPTNLLPKTPAGRLQRVIDMINNGFISREEALSLLDFPDLGDVSRNPSLDLVKAKIQAAINDDMMKALPSPYCDLNLLISEAQAKHQELESENAPEAVLERIRQTIEFAVEEIEKAEAAAAEAEAAEMAAQESAGAEGAPPPPEVPPGPDAGVMPPGPPLPPGVDAALPPEAMPPMPAPPAPPL